MAANRISFDKDSATALLSGLLATNGDKQLIAKLTEYLNKQGWAIPTAQPPVIVQLPEPVKLPEPVQPEPAADNPSCAYCGRYNAVIGDTCRDCGSVQPEPTATAQPEPVTAPEPVQPEPTATAQPEPAQTAPDSTDHINLATLPDYIAQNGEVDTVLTAVKAGLNIGLRGAAGCGKTHLVQSIAKQLGTPLYEIVCDGGTQREDVIGSRGYDGTQTYWIDGTATRALRHSKTAHVLLYIDEPTCLRDDVQSALYPIMDDRRHAILPENNGEIVQSTRSINGQPGLTIISSWNDGYRGTAALNEAFQDRYDVGITLNYLPAEREAKLLVKRTGIDTANAKLICEIGEKLRDAMREKQIITPISTRALLAYAALVVAGFDTRAAGEHTLVEKASGLFETERTIIRDVIHTFTAGGVTN